jgi:mannose-6-phosphate isomerase-like protein (cupin superfamily)
VSPAGSAWPLELVEVTFPPGRLVSFASAVRSVVTHQLVWVLEGDMEITVGEKTWRLRRGDCLAMVLDEHVSFRNPARKPARYALALTTAPQPLRRIR